MAQLSVRALTKRYGANVALDTVNLEVGNGELHAVIGPNGAGKSTLFAVIAGELRPTGGQVQLNGKDITMLTPQRRVRLGIARAFQISRIFASLSVLENVVVAEVSRARASGTAWRPLDTKLRARALPIIEEIGLADLRHRLAGELAQGDRKRLEIAMALQLGARLLLLDEPTAGMSPEETASTIELLQRLWRRGELTVLLTEHDMGVVFRLATQLTVLHRGAVLCSGSPEAIRKRDDVREVYLGRG